MSSLSRLEILQNGLNYSLDIEDSDNLLSFYVDIIRFHGLFVQTLRSDSFKYAIPGLYSNNSGKWFLLINNYVSWQVKKIIQV